MHNPTKPRLTRHPFRGDNLIRFPSVGRHRPIFLPVWRDLWTLWFSLIILPPCILRPDAYYASASDALCPWRCFALARTCQIGRDLLRPANAAHFGTCAQNDAVLQDCGVDSYFRTHGFGQTCNPAGSKHIRNAVLMKSKIESIDWLGPNVPSLVKDIHWTRLRRSISKLGWAISILVIFWITALPLSGCKARGSWSMLP